MQGPKLDNIYYKDNETNISRNKMFFFELYSSIPPNLSCKLFHIYHWGKLASPFHWLPSKSMFLAIKLNSKVSISNNKNI